MEKSSSSVITEYMENMIQVRTRQLIGRYGYTRADREDLVQTLKADLIERLHRYDPMKASLDTFAARVIDNCVSTLIRYKCQQCRDYEREDGSLDDPLDDREPNGITRVASLSHELRDYYAGQLRSPAIDQLDLLVDVSVTIRELPPFLKKVAFMLSQKSVAEVARELNIPRSTLYDRGIKPLRRILEDRSLREYL